LDMGPQGPNTQPQRFITIHTPLDLDSVVFVIYYKTYPNYQIPMFWMPMFIILIGPFER
jgi:hypothetical protein